MFSAEKVVLGAVELGVGGPRWEEEQSVPKPGEWGLLQRGHKTWDHLASWLSQAHAWMWGEGS